MHKLQNSCAILFVSILVFTAPSFALDTIGSNISTQVNSDISYRYKYLRVTHTVNPESDNTTVYDWSAVVLKQSALEDMKQTSISYSTSAEKAEVLEAFTIKADGRKIAVPRGNFQLEVDSNLEEGVPPAFSDESTMTIVFPELAVGDTVALKYKISQKEQYFPGQFSVLDVFGRSMAYDEVVVKVDAPTAVNLRYETPGFELKSQETRDGRTFLEWTYANKEALKNTYTSSSVFDFGVEPGYAISTFDSYADIAKAYGTRANAKAAVTPRIQKLADDLTKEKLTPAEQAKTLYEWVAENITYAGNCIGVGAVVPRDLDFVLDNNMGDCKDHATLLQALLTAKGIASTQALINASGSFTLPKVPSVQAINHVINYIPSLDLFVDSTDPSMPFGRLSAIESGRPVILVDGSKPDAKTPWIPSDYTQERVEITANISADGSAEGEAKHVLKGFSAISGQMRLKDLSQEKIDKWTKSLLKGFHLDGTVEFVRGDKGDNPEELVMVFKFKVKKLVEIGNAHGMDIRPLLIRPALLQFAARSLQDENSEHDFACAGGITEEVYHLSFPPNVKILSVPDNFSDKNEYIVYDATYRTEKNRIEVTRKLTDVTPGPVCKPAVADAYKQMAEKMMGDLKAQIVYK